MTVCLGLDLFPFILLVINGVLLIWRLMTSIPGNFFCSLFSGTTLFFRCSPRSILRLHYSFEGLFLCPFVLFFWEIFLTLSFISSNKDFVYCIISKNSSLPFSTSSCFLFLFFRNAVSWGRLGMHQYIRIWVLVQKRSLKSL